MIMATTKIWKVENRLEHWIDFTTNTDKREKQFYTTSISCNWSKTFRIDVGIWFQVVYLPFKYRNKCNNGEDKEQGKEMKQKKKIRRYELLNKKSIFMCILIY